MFPEWTIAELFEEFSGDPGDLVRHPEPPRSPGIFGRGEMADVEAVFATRLDFIRAMPPQELFETAQQIDMAGLSLNMLCQQYSDSDILRLLDTGTVIRCLFLDPNGTSIRDREIEEGHPAGLLTNLTDTNIRTLERIRNKASPRAPGSLLIRVYDQPIRFNITIIDAAVCVMQPYMPAARGVESPTFVARKSSGRGIFTTFSDVLESMWLDSRERRGE